MKIFCENRYYLNEAYSIYIQDKGIKKIYKIDKKLNFITEYERNKVIEIMIYNNVLESKYNVFIILLYWFLLLITGTGENDVIGLPYSLKLKVRILEDKDIIIYTNKYTKETPFLIESKYVEVLQNEFILEDRLKRKWICGRGILPIIIIEILNVFLFHIQMKTGMDIIKYIIIFLLTVLQLYFCYYCVKVIKRK